MEGLEAVRGYNVERRSVWFGKKVFLASRGHVGVPASMCALPADSATGDENAAIDISTPLQGG